MHSGRKQLLIVAHAPSPNTRALRDAALLGAQDIISVDTRCLSPFEAGPPDILACNGILLGTTENLGYMSGALKDFFDRSYYGVLDQTDGLALGVYIRAKLDGTGTRRAIESITGGLRWRPVAPYLVCHGEWKESFVDEARDLGMLMAAGLEAGVF